MIYLILSILFSTSLFVIFKLFHKYEVDNVKAIVVNYAVAFVLGFLGSETKIPLAEVNIDFVPTDVLELSSLDNQYDIIVSNPPYVRNLEKVEIKKNVLQFEPKTALFVEDDDPLLFYRKIGKLAFDSLTTNGYLFFEINQYLGKETVDLLSDLGYQQIELRKDLFGNDRMIKCQLS